MWILALRLYAFLWMLPVPRFPLLSCLYNPVGFVIVLIALIAIGTIYVPAAESSVQNFGSCTRSFLNPAVQAPSLLR